MTNLAVEKKTLTSKISVSYKPIWSFQNKVMIAIGKSIIFRTEKMFSIRTLLVMAMDRYRLG